MSTVSLLISVILGVACANAQVAPFTSARVLRVSPAADALPSNQLKLYLWFSESMSRGEAWQRIHLLDDAGKPVELPFLEIEQELWDREQRRLTVLFDPGRIKRGLVPNEELGPPLVEGKRYTLLIDAAFQDANGKPMAAAFRKEFRVAPEDRTPPDPKRWRVTSPAPNTRDAVILDFDESLDAAMLEHSIHVFGRRGKVDISRGENQWRFTPDEPWTAAEYRLVIDRRLEDLAGNRIGRAFDVDTFTRVSKEITRQTVELRFRVR